MLCHLCCSLRATREKLKDRQHVQFVSVVILVAPALNVSYEVIHRGFINCTAMFQDVDWLRGSVG